MGIRGGLTKEDRRPKKKPIERRRRLKTHKARLTAMGVPEEELRVMDNKQMRALLRSPAKTRAAYAKQAAN